MGVNVDQTSVRVLPTSTRGWAPKGKPACWAADTKRQVTVVLACFMEQDQVYGQVIYHGYTC